MNYINWLQSPLLVLQIQEYFGIQKLSDDHPNHRQVFYC